MPSKYSYVGPKEQSEFSGVSLFRARISIYNDLVSWLTGSSNSRTRSVTITATYVIDLSGALWLADQHTEHVACAGGQDVLAAGEMTLAQDENGVIVSEVTNQSTGYCPEPSSWPTVAEALDQLGVIYPSGFTRAYIFRRCSTCGSTNIIKDDWYECAVCGGPLSHEWNYGR